MMRCWLQEDDRSSSVTGDESRGLNKARTAVPPAVLPFKIQPETSRSACDGMTCVCRKNLCILKFSELQLDPTLMRGISDMGFSEPTPIQCAALPPALEGRDILASAMTGSGKTAAFVLPILQRLSRSSNRPGTRALVLTPTRELAVQVHEHLVDLGRHTGITATTVFGGVKPAAQIRALRSGVNVVVATPGRLLDHMQQPWFRIDQLEVLVLDEADRMLDMGFLPDIRRILARLPKRRQTMLFSATLPRPIVALSRDLLNQPVRLDIERREAPATGVRQAALPVPEQLKKDLLLEILRRDVKTALVFTRTKHRANRLARFLDRAGIPCDRIHGNRSQPQRQSALTAFKTGRIRVLVATDVASRGIDVEALPHVINFDVPVQPDDYIHRVGRTARAGTTGDALTFVSPSEEGELRAIERKVGRRIDRTKIDGFDLSAPLGQEQERAPKPPTGFRARNRRRGANGRATQGPKGPRSTSRRSRNAA
jgi:ATP-dependent RNA helicase RhlE